MVMGNNKRKRGTVFMIDYSKKENFVSKGNMSVPKVAANPSQGVLVDRLGQGYSVAPSQQTAIQKLTGKIDHEADKKPIFKTRGSGSESRSGGNNANNQQMSIKKDPIDEMKTEIYKEIDRVNVTKTIEDLDKLKRTLKPEEGFTHADIKKIKGIQEDLRKYRDSKKLSELQTLRDNPWLHWTSKLSFNDALGLRSLFAIGYGALQGKSDKELQKEVVDIQTEYIRDLKGAKKVYPGGAFTKQVIEGGLILAPTAAASVPVTSLRTAVTSLAGRGVLRGMQGYHIGKTIKDPTPENVFFAVAPILGETGIKAYSRLPAVQQRAILKDATSYRTALKDRYGKPIKDWFGEKKLKVNRLPGRDIEALRKLLLKANDYLDYKPKVKNLNFKEIEVIPNNAVKTIKDFIIKKKIIAGGSASNKAQMRSFRKPKDLDLYSKYPTTHTKQLVAELRSKGIRAGISRTTGDITLNGKKAIQIHGMDMFYRNVEKLTPFWRRKLSHHTTKTPEGMKVMKLTTQMRRKLIGSFEEKKYRYSKDMPDFRKIISEIEMSEAIRKVKAGKGLSRSRTQRRSALSTRGQNKKTRQPRQENKKDEFKPRKREYKKDKYYSRRVKGEYSIVPRGYSKAPPKPGYKTPRPGYKSSKPPTRTPTGYGGKKPEGGAGYPGKATGGYTGGYPTEKTEPYPGYKTTVSPYIPQSSRSGGLSISKDKGKRGKKKGKAGKTWQLVQDPFLRFLGRRKNKRSINLLKAQQKGNLYI